LASKLGGPFAAVVIVGFTPSTDSLKSVLQVLVRVSVFGYLGWR